MPVATFSRTCAVSSVQVERLVIWLASYGDATMETMKEEDRFYTKIKTTFNDGTDFIGDEIQTALVAGFTADSRGGIKDQEFSEWEPRQYFG